VVLPSTPLIVTRLSESRRVAEAGVIARSLAQTFELSGLRLRLVEYEAGYLADHWCDRGHILHVVDGDLTLELRDGRSMLLRKGDCFVVSDHGDASHGIRTASGGTAFIVD
jgi:quercetin dioxygenase-like cupin family protein